MIDLLLKLLENLGKLAEYRAAKKKRVFKEMAEPMFNELLEVHKNYMLIFAEARSAAELNPSKPSAAIQYLEKKRKEFEPVRVKIAAIAETLFQRPIGSPTDNFLHAVFRYFPVGDIYKEGGTVSTTLLRILKTRFARRGPKKGAKDGDTYLHSLMMAPYAPSEAERKVAFARVPESPAEIIDAFIALQQAKWKGVCDAFAKLKAADLETG